MEIVSWQHATTSEPGISKKCKPFWEEGFHPLGQHTGSKIYTTLTCFCFKHLSLSIDVPFWLVQCHKFPILHGAIAANQNYHWASALSFFSLTMLFPFYTAAQRKLTLHLRLFAMTTTRHLLHFWFFFRILRFPFSLIVAKTFLWSALKSFV